MTNNIFLSRGLRNSLYSLTDLQGSIDLTNNRLATGKKVNTALDNPLNFYTADSLASRGRALSIVQDNIGLGINVIQQATKAFESITSSLQQIQGALRSALNSAGTASKVTTTFNFRDNANNPVTNATAASVLLADPAGINTQNRFQIGDQLTIELVGITSTSAIGTTLGTGIILNINAGTTVQSLLDAVNVPTGTSTLNVTGQAPRVSAYLNDAGNIIVENNVQGAATTSTTYALRFTVNTNGAAVYNNTLDIFAFTGAVGASPVVTPTSTATQAVIIAGGTTAQQTRNSAAASFREVLNQIRNTALDAGYNGTNLLQGDFLRTSFNEDDTTSLITQGRRIDASYLGFTVDVTASFVGDALYSFQSDAEIRRALTKVSSALTQVQGFASTYGSNFNILQNRQDFTRNAVRLLNQGSDDLTLADINEEGANLAALQTRQQLAVQALALANQSDQAILRLF